MLLSGVTLYIFGVLLSFAIQYFNLNESIWLTANVLVILLFNPLMIYIYDLAFNTKALKRNFCYYDLIVIICYIFELLLWNWIRPLSGDVHVLKTIVGHILIVIFIAQFLYAIHLRKKMVSTKNAIMRLIFFPILTYDIFIIFGVWWSYMFSQWKG